MDYYIIAIFVSFFASLIGLILVKENRVPILFLFSFFLLLSIIVEYVGSSMSAHNTNTIPLYNFFTLFEFVFYLFFFRTLFSSPSMKKIMMVVIIFYFILAMANILFIQGLYTFHSFTFIIGSTLIVVFSISYFYFLFRQPESSGLIKNTFFWIATGLMFYYICAIPQYGLENFITQKIKYYNKLLLFIGDLLNVLLYTLFSIGFLCKVKFRKLSGL